jgi:predicted translin family RNA/ssDNA-binding protein
MFSKKNFDTIRHQLTAYADKREQIIKISRDILRFSKMAISCIHRNDLAMAEKHIHDAEVLIKQIKKVSALDVALSVIGAYSVSLQEYVEAKAFLHFIKHQCLIELSELNVEPEDYLMGLSDLTGELARRAVLTTISRNYSDVHLVRDFVAGIHDFFLTLDMGNGELRKKYDAIKWNLKKIEDVIYDIETKRVH